MKPLRPFEPYKIDQTFGNASSYGPHEGVDYNKKGTSGNQDCGTPLKAVCDGEVVHTSESTLNYGKLLVLRVETSNGTRYPRYCHCDEILVKSGFVKRGDTIARMGSTGNSTACHLHFDVLTKKPTSWRYYTKKIYDWFEDPEVFFNSDIINNTMSQAWMRQMFLETGVDIDKPEGEIRGRVQDILDGFKKYADLQKQVSELQKQVAFEAGQSAQFETELVQANKNLQALQSEINDLRRTMTQRDSEITKLTESVESLKAQLDPEKVILVPKEEYVKLVSTNGIEAYSVRDLVGSLLKRIIRRQRAN